MKFNVDRFRFSYSPRAVFLALLILSSWGFVAPRANAQTRSVAGREAVPIARAPQLDPASSGALLRSASGLGLSLDSDTFVQVKVGGVQFSVATVADGQEAATGVIGYAYVSGPNVPAGYYRLKHIINIPSGTPGPYNPEPALPNANFRTAGRSGVGLVAADDRLLAAVPDITQASVSARNGAGDLSNARDSSPNPQRRKINWDKVIQVLELIVRAIEALAGSKE